MYICIHVCMYTVQLKQPIVITTVTLEHIPKELTPTGSLSSAPKDFTVVVRTACGGGGGGGGVGETGNSEHLIVPLSDIVIMNMYVVCVM